jgi:hypothetical protein
MRKKKPMVRKKRKLPTVNLSARRTSRVANIGPILLQLRDALRRAERCRIALFRMGYSQKRWQEIVNEVNPELRFVLQSQMLDPIVTYLKSVGIPVERNRLARVLHAQGVGPIQRIKQSITTNLRSGHLTLHSGNRVGLPDWKSAKK